MSYSLLKVSNVQWLRDLKKIKWVQNDDHGQFT